MGKFYYNKKETVREKEPLGNKLKTVRKDRPKEDWVEINVPAIIDEELYNAAQLRMEKARKGNLTIHKNKTV